MNESYSPAFNVVGRVLILASLLAYGWVTSGWAGLLAMVFIACFLTFGAPLVVADGIWRSSWATVRWFLYFLVSHFVIFLINEQISEEMLIFLATTLESIPSWASGVSIEERFGFLGGLLLVVGIGWLLMRFQS